MHVLNEMHELRKDKKIVQNSGRPAFLIHQIVHIYTFVYKLLRGLIIIDLLMYRLYTLGRKAIINCFWFWPVK